MRVTRVEIEFLINYFGAPIGAFVAPTKHVGRLHNDKVWLLLSIQNNVQVLSNIVGHSLVY